MKRLVFLFVLGLLGLIAVQWQGEKRVFSQGKPVVVLSGEIDSNRTLSNSNDYVLSGTVFVVAPARLTIQPGTTIYGEGSTNGTLVIARGAQIVARGTADAPIVFTSDQGEGDRNRADWGGLIINGRAPINVPGGTAFGEGDTGAYGGSQANDNSGVLNYVRVEFAGTEFSPDNELNGIALQGVGRKTEIDHVQVHFNQDDCIEFFGGAADAKHVLCTGTRDDNLDWTEGWQGRLQFLVAQQKGDASDQGIEADNNAENNNLTPRSSPKIYNVTLIGAPKQGTGSDIGMLLREGTAGTIRNFVVMGFKEVGLEVDHQATFQQASTGALSIGNGILFQNGEGNFSNDEDEDPAPPFTTAEWAGDSDQIFQGNPGLVRPYNISNPDFRPRSGSALINGSIRVATPPNDGFFDVVDFIGALGPAAADDWTKGWTTFAQH
ncbi:MAG: T9SS C-terminal target domain-containing protein [Vicinamibacteria bacterium]